MKEIFTKENSVAKKERSKVFLAVYLLLFKENKTLLLLRKNTGWEDGKYSVIAGHVDQGESASEAVISEAKEEGAKQKKEEDLQFLHVVHRNSLDREIVDCFFTATRFSGKITNKEPDKCGELEFYEVTELPDNTIPYIREVIVKVMNKSLYSEFGWENSK
jgi:ADP-ribose pyrophosphatase YjhB (NUDIX family)